MNANTIKRTAIALVLARTAAVTAFEISGASDTHARTHAPLVNIGGSGHISER